MTKILPVSSGENSPVPKRGSVYRFFRVLGSIIGWVTIVILSLWATLAVYYSDLAGSPPRSMRATLTFIAIAASITVVRPKIWGRIAFILLFLGTLAWFLTRTASNDRDWLPDVAQVATVDIEGDNVTVHSVRNFDYRSETDFTSRWEDRRYRLSNLRGVDMALSYWGSKAIAHGITSFDFGNGDYLAVSIETRKERSEGYSTIQGFFCQYELIYVFADERDLLRVRTNYRNEDLYLYHVRASADEARAFFLSYVQQANSLARQPQFYNTATSNCVSNIVTNAQGAHLAASRPWEFLLSGYAASTAYRNGRVDTSLPFEELESKSRITSKALAAENNADFSRTIRIGLPMPGAKPAQ